MSRKRKKQRPRPSAVVALLRELDWECDNETRRVLVDVARALRRWIPLEGRVVLVDPDQATAFAQRPDDELFDAAIDAVSPFRLMVVDTGFVSVSPDYELPAIVVQQDFDAAGQPTARWMAVSFLRRKGTDNWGQLQTYADEYVGNRQTSVHVLGDDAAAMVDQTMRGVHAVLAGVMSMLESVNVELVDGPQPVKGHRAHGIPHYEVVVRQPTTRTKPSDPHITVDWSHQWEVRGHFKHFGPDTALYRKSPHRRLVVRGQECVRLWCPPHVKGPPDKPFIPKTRILA